MSDIWSQTDRAAMRAALEVAEKGRGFTSPNPVVGAVVVADGRIISTGYHERWGGPHAEVSALADAGARARGATLYVTLEPCCVWGKTPPCTDAILRAGIARVIVPIEDPNPAVAGGGIEALRRAGVEVRVGLLRAEAALQNAPYFKWRRTGLPHVFLKLAVTLDGRIAAPPGGDRWISSQASRRHAHAMRAAADAVMVGVGTVVADDPLLTDRRSPTPDRQPARIIVDTRLRLPAASRVAAGAREVTTIVACCAGADEEAERRLSSLGVRVWRLPPGPGGVDLRATLEHAASEGLVAVLCEGGGRVATSLLREGLVDEVAFFVAPRILGEDGVPALGRLGRLWREGSWGFEDVRWTDLGDDRLMTARVARREATADTEKAGEVECSRA